MSDRSMILPNRDTGDIHLGRMGARIHISMRLDEFLGSAEGQNAMLASENNEYKYYRLGNRYSAGSVSLGIGIGFSDDHVSWVNMFILEEADSSWATWSEAHEIDNAQILNQLIVDEYGSAPPLRFRWGKLESGYDPRSASSSMRISYDSSADVQRVQ